MQRDYMESMPHELMRFVLLECPDLVTLNNLIVTSRNARSVFIANHQRLIETVLGRQMVPELAITVHAIMRIFDNRPASPFTLEGFSHACLGLSNSPLKPFQNPTAVLGYIAQTFESVDALTRSLGHDRILMPEFYLAKEGPSSLTASEHHRIQRALWSFQLCYDVCHPVASTIAPEDWKLAVSRWDRSYVALEHSVDGWLCGHGWRQPPYSLEIFRNKFEIWEEDELEAIRYHLRSEVNKVQFERDADGHIDRSVPQMIRRLLRDADHWRPNQVGKHDHLLVARFEKPVPRSYKDQLPPWVDSPKGTQGPSLLHCPVDCFFNYEPEWGWRLWDQSRLRKRSHMIPLGGLRLNPNPAPRPNSPNYCSRQVNSLQLRTAPCRTTLEEFIEQVDEMRQDLTRGEKREKIHDWDSARDFAGFIEQTYPEIWMRWCDEGLNIYSVKPFEDMAGHQRLVAQWRAQWDE